MRMLEQIVQNRSVAIGYSGSSVKVTDEQMQRVEEILTLIEAVHSGTGHSPHFHHGNCVEGDEKAAAIACKSAYYVVAHPGHMPRMQSTLGYYDVALDPMDNLERNKEIVDIADIMITTPREVIERKRGSGTWQAIRYTRRQRKPMYLILPSGTVYTERFITS